MNQRRKDRLVEITRSLQDLRTGKSLHFSFILNKNQLLVTAANSYNKMHPYHIFGRYLPTKENNGNYIAALHSETNAIKEYINRFGTSDFSGMTLFNVRLGKDGFSMLAKPCENCQRLLKSFNFKEIDWTV
jgi:hypothetical protein